MKPIQGILANKEYAESVIKDLGLKDIVSCGDSMLYQVELEKKLLETANKVPNPFFLYNEEDFTASLNFCEIVCLNTYVGLDDYSRYAEHSNSLEKAVDYIEAAKEAHKQYLENPKGYTKAALKLASGNVVKQMRKVFLACRPMEQRCIAKPLDRSITNIEKYTS